MGEALTTPLDDDGQRPRVVVVGAGFAGLAAVRGLRRGPVRVTVIDRSNHHLFQPLLYQVATAALNPSDIAQPIRRIFRGYRNVEVLLAVVEGVDIPGRRVLTDAGPVPFDFLIVATGATHSYFGHPDWEADAPGLKTIEDALEIRRRMLLAFEEAERTTDPSERSAWMTFVIVGGGPTGVELAGTLKEVARKTLAKDFRHIDPSQARVLLVEHGPNVLASYAEELSRSARLQLERIGVEVRTGALASAVNSEGVTVGTERIATRTVLWAAGVEASNLGRLLGAPLDHAGRVIVRPDLTIPSSNRIFVVGDLMHVEQDGVLVPGVAPAAMQAGAHAALNLRLGAEGKPRLPFRYIDKGNMATIGRAAAVADIRGWRFSGLPAWLLWLFIHILFLIGFRNRLLVMIQWGISYFTYDRGARLITGRWKGRSHSTFESSEKCTPTENSPTT
jgi:NADH:quinone reductase (non-electrogenic)